MGTKFYRLISASFTSALIFVLMLSMGVENGVAQCPQTIAISLPNGSTGIINGGTVTFCPGDTATLCVPNGFGPYQWYKNGGVAISGETNFCYKATDNGCYYVTSGGCTGQASNIVCIVLWLPPNQNVSVTYPTPPVLCPPTDCAVLTVTNPLANVDYYWIIPPNPITGPSISIGGLCFTSSKNVTSLAYDNNGCSTSKIIPVHVDNLLAGTIQQDTSICQGVIPHPLIEKVGQPTTGGTPPYTYQWQQLVGASWVTPPGCLNSTTQMNYQPCALTVTTSFRRLDSDLIRNCPKKPTNVVTITVNPLPVPTLTHPPACVGLNITYVTNSGGGINSYLWNTSCSACKVSGGGAADPSITMNWPTTGPQWVSVSYTDGNGCTTASPTQYNFTVNPLPNPSLSGQANPCQNVAGYVYTTQAGMSSYTWPPFSGGTINFGGTPSSNTATVTWSAVGPQTLVGQTISVNYTDMNGCSGTSAIPFPVNVLPAPAITITETPPGSHCVGTTKTYTTETGMTNYIWVVPPGGSVFLGGGLTDNFVTVNWISSGNFQVSVNYTAANGCPSGSPHYYNVNIDPLPVPTITSPTLHCKVAGALTYTTEAAPMTGYIWTTLGGTITGGGNGVNNATVSWGTIGPYYIEVKYTNSVTTCSALTSTRYYVYDLPNPTITQVSPSPPTDPCEGSSSNVYTTQSGMNGYTWTVYGGTIVSGGLTNSVTVKWGAPIIGQKITVNYTDNNGCQAVAATEFSVNVLPAPVVTITALNDPPCAGSCNAQYQTAPFMSGYAWQVQGGTICPGVTPPNLITVNWGTVSPFWVKVNYTDPATGCQAVDFATHIVSVKPLPVPVVDPSSPTSACVETTPCGTPYTYFTTPGKAPYIWTVSAGGSICSGIGTNSITVSWNTPGAQHVSLNYTDNGCTALLPTDYPVTVYARPLPTITGPNTACVGGCSYQYSTLVGPSITNYSWSVSGGTICSGYNTDKITVDWNLAGTHTITVSYDEHGCAPLVPASFSVNVSNRPVINPPTGLTPVAITGDAIYYATTGMSGYQWSLPLNGGTFITPQGLDHITVHWTTLGTFPLCVNYTDQTTGCDGIASCKAIEVLTCVPPTASFTNTLSCSSMATIFTSTSTTVSPYSITNMVWTFGDGGTLTSTSSPVSHSYLSAGTYNVTLRVTNSINCVSDLFIKQIQVSQSPLASFLSGNACLGQAVAFTNTSTLNGGSQISNYLYDFDDLGNTSTDPNPNYTFSVLGSYNVSLKVTNTDGCSNTYTINPALVVHPKPSVDFTFWNGTQNWEIMFHNITGAPNGNNLVWDYGDGTYGYGPDPSHIYLGPGNFLVTLTATDLITNCSNSIQKLVTVVSTLPAFFTSDSHKCIGDTMHFTPQIPGGNIVKEVWDFGDGTVVTYIPPAVFPVFAKHLY
ncbi:MAG: PKD domain-containing protein, partial [Mariniphaga sp.]